MTKSITPKRRPGRPPILKTRGNRRNLYVSEADYERLKTLGGGNASHGIRVALARAETPPGYEKADHIGPVYLGTD